MKSLPFISIKKEYPRTLFTLQGKITLIETCSMTTDTFQQPYDYPRRPPTCYL